MTALAIATRGLTKRYRERTAVDSLDLAVPAGAVTGFVGPNGAGKTTTIRMLLGLIRASSGTGHVLGHPLTAPTRYLERVGSLVDGPAFYPRLSGRANLRVLGRLAGRPAVSRRTDEVLELTGLTDRAGDPVAAYSMGMRQRLALAAALLPDPALVILDEPANGLDPAGIREIRRLLRQLAGAGLTVFVSSHQLSELEQICDQLVLLRAGRMCYQGPLAGLLAQRPMRITARTADPGHLPAVAELARREGWPARLEEEQLVLSAPAEAAGRLNLLAHGHGIVVTELGSRPPTLEEIFFALTEDGERVAGEGGDRPAGAGGPAEADR